MTGVAADEPAGGETRLEVEHLAQLDRLRRERRAGQGRRRIRKRLEDPLRPLHQLVVLRARGADQEDHGQSQQELSH